MLSRQQAVLATVGVALVSVALTHCSSSDAGPSSAAAGSGGVSHAGSGGGFAVAGKGGTGSAGAAHGGASASGGAGGSNVSNAGSAGEVEGGCTTDTSCTAGMICETGTCQAAQCAINEDCGSVQVCQNQRCVTPMCTPPAVALSYAPPAGTLAVGLIGSFNGWSTGAASAAPWLLTHGTSDWSGNFVLAKGSNIYKFFTETATACTADLAAGAAGTCLASQVCLQAHCWDYVSDPSNPHTSGDGFGGLNAIIDMSCTGVIPYVAPVAEGGAGGESGNPGDGGAAAAP